MRSLWAVPIRLMERLQPRQGSQGPAPDNLGEQHQGSASLSA